MYRAKLWDEDKWNIHASHDSSKYSSVVSEKKDIEYHEQKYGQQEKDISSDYMKRDNKENKDDEIHSGSALDNLEEEKKESKEITEDEIKVTAAKQVFNETKNEIKKMADKKEVNTIEDAINRAIEGEKKVIIID